MGHAVREARQQRGEVGMQHPDGTNAHVLSLPFEPKTPSFQGKTLLVHLKWSKTLND
jgi:sugar lactone lactonase YvrE